MLGLRFVSFCENVYQCFIALKVVMSLHNLNFTKQTFQTFATQSLADLLQVNVSPGYEVQYHYARFKVREFLRKCLSMFHSLESRYDDIL